MEDEEERKIKSDAYDFAVFLFDLYNKQKQKQQDDKEKEPWNGEPF